MRRAIEPHEYRSLLSAYPTGVSIVTALSDEGWPIGLTIGTFTSVSLDPPLVGFLPARDSGTWKQIAATGSFCVNVLAEEQGPLCQRFGVRPDHRFYDLPWHAAPATGSPVLEDVLAWIDCTVESVVGAGDHWFVMGRVHAYGARDGRPIVFCRGAFGTVRLPGDTAPTTSSTSGAAT